MTKYVSEPTNVTDSATHRKLVRAIGVGVCIGLAVVLVVGFLIPLPEPSQVDAPKEEQSELQSNALQYDVGNLKSTFDLPGIDDKKVIDVADLQRELTQLANRLTNEYPEDCASFHIAAQIYFELKQFDIAEQLWKKSLEANPRYMGPYVGLATLMIDKGRNEEAIEILESAEKLGGQSPEMLLKLGEALENTGDLEKSLQRLQEAAKLFSENGDIWFALGRVQNQSNQPVDAESSLKRAIQIGGEKEPVLFALNASLMRQKKIEESAAVREKMAKLKQPKQNEADSFQDRYDMALIRIAADVFNSAATISEANNKLDDANALYLRSLDLAPRNIETYSGLLYVARRQERFAEQRQLLSKLIELDPKNLLNYTNLASIAMQMGDAKMAEKALSSAIEIDPTGVLAQAASAKFYLGIRSFSKARGLALQVVERQPSPAAYRLLAATYQAEGMEEKFMAAIQKADEIEKANPNNLVPN